MSQNRADQTLLLYAASCCACYLQSKHKRPTPKTRTKHQTRDSRKPPSHQGEPQTQPANTAAAGRRRSSCGSEKQQLQQAEITAGQWQQQQLDSAAACTRRNRHKRRGHESCVFLFSLKQDTRSCSRQVIGSSQRHT